MTRPLIIVTLTGLFTLSGIAAASPVEEVRVPAPAATARGAARFVTVERGDHLWKISARHLLELSPATEIAPYWRRVVSLNRASLASGDPDLIYPGETIEMPELNGRQ